MTATKDEPVYCHHCEQELPLKAVTGSVLILEEWHTRMARHGKSGTQTKKSSVFDSQECLITWLAERKEKAEKSLEEASKRFRRNDSKPS
jgi:hypothetical protein